jgi:hypothetical protein
MDKLEVLCIKVPLHRVALKQNRPDGNNVGLSAIQGLLIGRAKLVPQNSRIRVKVRIAH